MREYEMSNASREELNLSDSRLQEILDRTGEYGSRMDGRHILIFVLSVLAFVTNGLTLTAICYIRRRLSANQMMMLSLCCADLLSSVGIFMRSVIDHSFNMHLVAEEKKYAATCLYKVVMAITLSGHNATLFNLLSLAVDHYCAIAKPLTHNLYMSKSRVQAILVTFWILAVIFGFSDFWMPSPLHSHCMDHTTGASYCTRVFCTVYEADHLMFCIVLTCLVVMTAMYGSIMCILRTYQKQEYATVSQRKAQRHIRGLITSFIILGLFTVLWLPSCIMDAYTILRVHYSTDFRIVKTHSKLMWYLYALVILNAVCDPIIYALRMREIQESLKSLLRFKRRTFSNKMNGFEEALRNRSSNSSIPFRFTYRQYSTNSTNTTVYSGVSGSSLKDKQGFSRKGTLTSQVSEMTEDTPLSGNIPMPQLDCN